jgi:hypothetical protein
LRGAAAEKRGEIERRGSWMNMPGMNMPGGIHGDFVDLVFPQG